MAPTTDTYRGEFADKRMENAHYWAAQLRQWMFDGPNAGLEGTFYVQIRAGQAILVLDDEWGEDSVKAITDALRDDAFPTIAPKHVRELDDEWRVFIQPTDDRLISNSDTGWRKFESDTDFEDTAV